MVATKWSEVTLCKYERLLRFINSGELLTDVDRSIEIYSLLSDDPDKTREKLINMTILDLTEELSKIQFISEPYKSKIPHTEYMINGKKYTVQLNLQRMTAAQYIDFQNFYKEYDKNLKYIFLCFFIPKHKKYNEGYDLMELAEELYDKITIDIVTDVMVFFCRLLESLTVSTLISSIRETTKLMKKTENKSEKMAIARKIVELRNTLNSVKSGIESAELTR